MRPDPYVGTTGVSARQQAGAACVPYHDVAERGVACDLQQRWVSTGGVRDLVAHGARAGGDLVGVGTPTFGDDQDDTGDPCLRLDVDDPLWADRFREVDLHAPEAGLGVDAGRDHPPPRLLAVGDHRGELQHLRYGGSRATGRDRGPWPPGTGRSPTRASSSAYVLADSARSSRSSSSSRSRRPSPAASRRRSGDRFPVVVRAAQAGTRIFCGWHGTDCDDVGAGGRPVRTVGAAG